MVLDGGSTPGPAALWVATRWAGSPGCCRSLTGAGARAGGRCTQPGPCCAIEQKAGDTVGLVEALGIDRAHVSGGSMGGMVHCKIGIGSPLQIDGQKSQIAQAQKPRLSMAIEKDKELE